MKKQQFIETIGFAPKSTLEAMKAATLFKITFRRRNAHLKAWFGNGNGNLLPSKHNVIG